MSANDSINNASNKSGLGNLFSPLPLSNSNIGLSNNNTNNNNVLTKFADADEEAEMVASNGTASSSGGEGKASREGSRGGASEVGRGSARNALLGFTQQDPTRQSSLSFHGGNDSNNQSLSSLHSGSYRVARSHHQQSPLNTNNPNSSNKKENGSGSGGHHHQREKIRREGSRLILGDENKNIEEKADLGEDVFGEGCATSLFRFLRDNVPWAIRPDDSGLERERRVAMIDAVMVTAVFTAFPMLVTFAISVDEHIKSNSLEATRVVTLVLFILQFIIPFGFWIGINIQNDSEFKALEEKEKIERQKEKVAANTANLLQREMNKQPQLQQQPPVDNSQRLPPLTSSSASVPPPPSPQMVRTNSHGFGIEIQPTPPKDSSKPTKIPRPPLNALAIDIMITLIMSIWIAVGVCWRGISIVMLIALIRSYARTSRCGTQFMQQRVQLLLLLVGGLYLLVKGAQESFLINPTTTIAASTTFYNSPGSYEDIVAVVVGAVNFTLLGLFFVMNNELTRVAVELLKEYAARRLKDKESSLLTHAEQHVAGGLITALTKLEPGAARKLAEKYITANSPGILRGLSQLATNMETYLPFVPAWVKNPTSGGNGNKNNNANNNNNNADDEEEELDREDEDAENAELQESSETWSSSHNESMKSALGGKMFANSSLNASSNTGSFLTKDNVAKIGGDNNKKLNNENGGAGGGEDGVFGEYNLDYDSDGDDDIMSVKQGGNDNNNDNNKNNTQSPMKNKDSSKKSGGAVLQNNNTNAIPVNLGFNGKIVIATLQFNLDYKKYARAKATTNTTINNNFGILPNAVPDNNNNNNNNNPEVVVHDTTTIAEIERTIVDRICEICASSGGILHSIVANRVIVSWNTMTRIAAPEHKAARFLVTSRKLAASDNNNRDALFPGLKITGACMTGHGRAMISNAGSMVTSVVCCRWFKELELLGILAAQEDALLCDLATKHAVFLEFSVRGFGCLASVKNLQGQQHNNPSKGAGMVPPRSNAPKQGITPKPKREINNNTNGSSNENYAEIKRSQSDILPLEPPSSSTDPTPGGLTTTTSMTHNSNADLLAIFSLIGRRTGNNVEWMYLLQGGDDDSGAADPAAVSCSAMDHAAAGNFPTAKKYVDQALRLCENEAADLLKKRNDMLNSNVSMTQRQKDEADALEEQIDVNSQSTYMFQRLSKRLENATVESFPFKLVVQ